MVSKLYLCQKRKPGPGIGKSPINHVDVSAPLDGIAIDIMGPLPVTEKYSMVLGDYFSKWTKAYALPAHTAQIVFDKLVTEFICSYGTCSLLTKVANLNRNYFQSCKLLEITKS